jgi:hypothetical protein
MRNKYTKLIVFLLILAYASTVSAAITNPAPGIFVDLSDRGGNTFYNLALIIVQFLLSIVGLISILFIIIGGYRYITSGGNEEAAEAGKKALTNAIIGLVIVILSYVIVVVVANAI